MSKAWQDLEPELFGPVYQRIWDCFYAKFAFRPSVEPVDWPGIIEPSPSVTYSISSLYDKEGEGFHKFVIDLHKKALNAFRNCTNTEEFLYVLDWNHPAYRFFPHVPSDSDDSNVWRLPVFPDGDYYIFANKDFSLGTFGHPWEQTICVFGA